MFSCSRRFTGRTTGTSAKQSASSDASSNRSITSSGCTRRSATVRLRSSKELCSLRQLYQLRSEMSRALGKRFFRRSDCVITSFYPWGVSRFPTGPLPGYKARRKEHALPIVLDEFRPAIPRSGWSPPEPVSASPTRPESSAGFHSCQHLSLNSNQCLNWLSQPRGPPHHRNAILHLVPLGRLDEAEAEIRTPLNLDRASLNNRVILAKILYFRRKYEEAASKLQEVLKMDPNYSDGLRNLGAVYLQQGRHSRSGVGMPEGAVPGTNELGGRGYLRMRWRSLAGVASLFRSSGHSKQRPALTRHSPSQPIISGCKGMRTHSAGSARIEQDVRLMFLEADPIYDPVRSDPRFRKIVRVVGLMSAAELQ